MKVLFFTYHFPPDQSAGARRCDLLASSILNQYPNTSITVICTRPHRYGLTSTSPDAFQPDSRLRILRLWVPFLGSGALASSFSFVVYACQAVPLSLFFKPDIVFASSAKLLTSLIAATSSHILRKPLFLDIRDTFTDNFFYFYRWNKRILLQGFVVALENLVLRSASSVNVVSQGFFGAYSGWERLLKKYSISLTNYTNGIHPNLIKQISASCNLPRNSRLLASLPTIAYIGNIGEGQDLLSLISDLRDNEEAQSLMRLHRIKLDLYGSGSQVSQLLTVIGKPEDGLPFNSLCDLVEYHGLFPTSQVPTLYSHCNTLMLHIAAINSLSMVIPSKIFEYASTPYPVLYAASGYTSDFLQELPGTYRYTQGSSLSFVQAVILSRSYSFIEGSRDSFLSKFNSQEILKEYSSHLYNESARISFRALQ